MPLIHRFAERAIKQGRLTIIEHNGRTAHFGRPAPGFPNVTVRGMDRTVARDIAYRLDLGAGEAYMNGRIVIEEGDILDLISLLRLNNPWEQAGAILEPGPLLRFLDAARGRIDRLNWSRRSKRNVAHHYDLDDGLYDLFLDAERQYSCGYFLDPANSLEQAQTDKLAHIAAKLALQPGQRVLDIGCGWGGLAVYLARHRGVEVLGITLSERQLRFARERAGAEGLSALVKFELIDYRAVTGKFDRIVSVGMFEHVGPPHYKTFFKHCANLLTEQGSCCSTRSDACRVRAAPTCGPRSIFFLGATARRFPRSLRRVKIAGSYCPTSETLRLHYAMTLRHWYARTIAARAQIAALYDDRFYRMWQFYLAGAVVAFQGGSLCNYQLQYTRSAIVIVAIATALPGGLARGSVPAALIALLMPPMAVTAREQAIERRNDTRRQAVEWARTHIPRSQSVVLETLLFEMLHDGWSFRYPIGALGCVDVDAMLDRRIDYELVERAQRGRAMINLGTIDPTKVVTCRADYAIITERDRYAAEASGWDARLSIYDALLVDAKQVALFKPRRGAVGGPVVRIFRLPPA